MRGDTTRIGVRPPFRRRSSTVGAVLALTLSFHPTFASSEWLPDGNPIAASTGPQLDLSMLPDGAGGVLLVWTQHRFKDVLFDDTDSSQVRLTWLAASGETRPGWPQDGLVVDERTFRQYSPMAALDREGNISLLWRDSPTYLDGPSQRHGNRMQQLRTSGRVAPGWPEYGLTLDPSVGLSTPQVDELSGLYSAWGTGLDVGLLRLEPLPSLGMPWGYPGVAMDTTVRVDRYARSILDGAGGACVVWMDIDSGGIFARRIDASGVASASWPAEEIAVGRARTWFTFDVARDEDGFFVAWSDRSDRSLGLGVPTGDILLQRVRFDSGLTPEFPPGGVRVCSARLGQFDPAVCTLDGDAVVAWTDFRDSTTVDIYAQRVTATGEIAPGWPENGALVAGGPRRESEACVLPASEGHVWIAWQDAGQGGGDVFIQKLDATGSVAPGWPVGGRRIGPAAGLQADTRMVDDGAGGVFLAWTHREFAAGKAMIRITRVTATGEIASEIPPVPAPPSLRFVEARPNPGQDAQLLVFELSRSGPVTIDIHDVTGRLHRRLEPEESFDTGTRGVWWDCRDEDGRRLASGVYFARVQGGGLSATGKLLLLP